MVEGVDPPAERVHVLDHRLEEGIGLYRRLQIVAAGGQVEGVVDDERKPRAFDFLST